MNITIRDFTILDSKQLKEIITHYLTTSCFIPSTRQLTQEELDILYSYSDELDRWGNFFRIIEEILQERRKILRNCPNPMTIGINGLPSSNEDVRYFIKNGGLAQVILNGLENSESNYYKGWWKE